MVFLCDIFAHKRLKVKVGGWSLYLNIDGKEKQKNVEIWEPNSIFTSQRIHTVNK